MTEASAPWQATPAPELPAGAISLAPPSESQTRKQLAFVPPAINNIVPYILVNGAAGFIDFLSAAFAGREKLRVPRADGSITHAEVAIGDSIIELGDTSESYAARPMTIHLYVDDADATYGRALQAGGKSVYEVSDQPWGDRQGCVADPFGNVWYIGMPKGWSPGAAGLTSVQPYLHLRDAHKMIAFATEAFGATAEGVALSPEGKVLHATIHIAYATIEIDEAYGEFQPTPFYLHAYFPDTDAVYASALQAGAISIDAPRDMDYGERSATVKDPFGNTWFLATYRGIAA